MLSLVLMWSLIAPSDVRVSHRHLVVTCVAGQPVSGKTRKWELSQPTTFTFTMRNEPRSGVENQDPGLAVISFTPEAGHQYEIEVRGDASAFSRRVWTKGAWQPVVRDRTTDRLVSSEPVWLEQGCK